MSPRRVTVLVTLVGGLLLMHGLGTHGTSHGEGHAGAGQVAHVASMPMVEPVAASAPRPTSDGGMTGLCVAVLGGSLLLLLFTSVRTTLACSTRPRRSGRGVAPRARDPAPPRRSVPAVLSVRRC